MTYFSFSFQSRPRRRVASDDAAVKSPQDNYAMIVANVTFLLTIIENKQPESAFHFDCWILKNKIAY